MKKRVAVAGAGLAGIASVWFLLKNGFEVVLFDPKGIGGGASGVSTGLLHPFPGKKASRSWRSAEGMEATRELLAVAEKALGRSVADLSGIFRPAITQQQRVDFQALIDPDAVWKQISLPGMSETSGLWIQKGITVFSRLYLQGLWKACEREGATFMQEKFSADASFDAAVWATGFEMTHLEACKDLSLRSAIGQSLLCKWKDPLPFSLASQGYITVTENPNFCQVGSTYEHTKEPDPKKALELIEKVSLFYPPAKDFSIVEIRSGTRISPKDGHQPIVKQVDKKTWVFTGLGSRGMLYHALISKELVLDMLRSVD